VSEVDVGDDVVRNRDEKGEQKDRAHGAHALLLSFHELSHSSVFVQESAETHGTPRSMDPAEQRMTLSVGRPYHIEDGK
jgi:hypothetical protein